MPRLHNAPPVPHAAPPPTAADALIAAGRSLLVPLTRGQRLDARLLREAMNGAFGASAEAAGTWVWKDAYEAVEIAQLLFQRQHLVAIRKRAASPEAALDMLARLAALMPTHTRRSEESQALQQFSTPLELAFIAALAADIGPADRVLEPSAGTGQLAVHAEAAGASLILNELASTRADILARLFANAPLSRADAAQIDDHLPRDLIPSVVLINPPFSVAANIKGNVADAWMRHLSSALARLAPGGRLVAITGANAAVTTGPFAARLADLYPDARVVFTQSIDGSLYRRYGTTVDTRLTIIDRRGGPAADIAKLPVADTAQALLAAVLAHRPQRAPVALQPAAALLTRTSSPGPGRPQSNRTTLAPPIPAFAPDVIEVAYACRSEAAPQARISQAIYEPYALETITIDGAQPHPSKLVQSAAMASVNPPRPTYRPHLPAAVIRDGLLSDAQIESVIYAGNAHASHISGHWTLNESLDVVTPAAASTPGAVRFRRGWFLGDGTGAGKGRQVAGILLDNWLKGRRRALWISKSDKLLEDAQRDWSALGQEKLLVVPLDRFPQGKPVRLAEGILFTTYATLRSAERAGKASRLDQILSWLGREPGQTSPAEFDGVIVFDEAHAMANAAGTKSERGDRGPSQQGLAGLRLQHALPDARIVYVSATGATTVDNLAYAQRLGLWGSDDFPFASRADFVAAMHEGGIASLEVLARDLKALGLYAARSLSYEGVEVDILEHALTPEQIAIYDAYADAFQIIHHNLNAALKAANITGEGGTQNRQAKSAARSAFESNKQRFFNHLITAMKMPSLLRAIEADRAAGNAAIVQIVSTSEALMERRLAQIPAAEWSDLSVDITPREYVLDYLAHGFPTQLYESYSDDEGNILSRPVLRDGQPVQCRQAEALRDALLEKLAALPPVQGALDQLIHHFGTEAVAEITGRTRRIVRTTREGRSILAAQNRTASAALSETQAFMDGAKTILVFSDAGGTGRSYHADRNALNQRPRVHYLLEAGWKADAAVQGLGRSNRTNQVHPPLFRPVATDVRGEKRFLSTIARRLDTLGAITRGQRQTGGQGLFRPEDNLESRYARAALRQLYVLIWKGRLAFCSLEQFTEATGLALTDQDGTLLEELPPIHTFLNRVLALRIALQNALFEAFDDLLAAQIDGAVAAGTFEVGLETIRAESLTIRSRRTIATHAASAAETVLIEVQRKERNTPRTLADALALAGKGGTLVTNTTSNRAAVCLPAASWTLDDGTVQPRVQLVRPMAETTMPRHELDDSNWAPCSPATFSALWTAEVDAVPEFSETTFHMLTGLLLPIWKRLPLGNPRVYRFSTDDGERIIGRLVPPALLSAFGIDDTPPDAAAALAAVKGGRTLCLADGLAVRQARVMGLPRIELTGFAATALDRLKALGLISEIIAWQLRLFIPSTEAGVDVLERLLAQHPVMPAPGAQP